MVLRMTVPGQAQMYTPHMCAHTYTRTYAHTYSTYARQIDTCICAFTFELQHLAHFLRLWDGISGGVGILQVMEPKVDSVLHCLQQDGHYVT